MDQNDLSEQTPGCLFKNEASQMPMHVYRVRMTIERSKNHCFYSFWKICILSKVGKSCIKTFHASGLILLPIT